LADYFPLEPETHLLPIRFMERKTGHKALDEAPKQLLMWPRETGKSSIGTVAAAVQLACRNPEAAILIANEKQEMAADFLASIKHQFERNELLRALFPEVIPPDFNKTTWSATRASVNRKSGRKEPTFDTIGVGGSVTGKHYDYILCDDLISKDEMESARAGSWLTMDRVNRWVNQLEPLLSIAAKPFPWIRFIGTRWWHNDTYDHIEKAFGGEDVQQFVLHAKLPDGRQISREAYRAGDLAVMRISGIEDGIPTFPKIWSEERMASLRERDPELFACNIMNEPSNAAVRTFQDSWLRFWSRLDNKLIAYDRDDGSKRYVMDDNLLKTVVVDPAFTTSRDSDQTAIIVLGTDPETGKHLVLEAISFKMEPRESAVEVIEACRRHKATRLYIESVGQQLAYLQFVKREALDRNATIMIEPVKPGGRNKDVRIESMSAFFKSGQILVHNTQSALLDPYRRYRPGARQRDVLDALAYAVEKAPQVARSGMGDAKMRSRAGLDEYYRRRGLDRMAHAT
jgi:predicted phage terminase large subunit-like protein